MRIGIDVRYLSHGLMGGVHTYVRHFVPAVAAAAAGRHELFLYADTKRPFELTDWPAHVTVRYLPYRNPLSSVANDFSVSTVAGRDRLDVMHHPANYGFGPAGAAVIVTLHDALNILPLRQIFQSSGTRWTARTVAMTLYLHTCSRAALQGARCLFTVSEHAKQAITHHSRFDPGRIMVVPHAPTPDMRRLEDPATLAAVRQRFDLRRPFVLADGLKNPGVIVRAWERLPAALRASHEIVFFARRPDVLPVVQTAVTTGCARLLVRPDRPELVALYNLARAFIFPSWIEGFGIPVLEAMVCGAPVIASNRGSIPEVAGAAALLVDAEDEAALAGQLERVLADPAEADRLRQLGFARAAQFTWPRIAAQMLAGYEQAVQG